MPGTPKELRPGSPGITAQASSGAAGAIFYIMTGMHAFHVLTGLIFLYSKLGRSDYVMIAALTLIFSIMTSYARARAESLVEKCKVGFMERPERIVVPRPKRRGMAA